MTLHYVDDHLEVHVGDCREVLATLPAESVHCVVTSPPYWGLRDYGTASWAGGDEGCDHKGPPLTSDKSGLAGYTSENIKLRTNGTPYLSTCGKCGATRIDSQLGLEPTPEAYVANMVEVFREVRRVLRKDGTCWVNMGDGYASHDPGGYRPGEFLNPGGRVSAKERAEFKKREYEAVKDIVAGSGRNRAGQYRPGGLKPKDLIGMPWRLAFALQADGWYLRSDIIWSKPNPMPESVTDRPTKSHEYVFLLSKSARYYYDAEAVREANVTQGDRREGNGRFAYDGKYDGTRDDGTQQAFVTINPAGRNLRDVWTIAAQPYPGAHFATFPEALVEPCVKAGCPAEGTVLDPFAGSGTTGLVANRLGRRAILIDLSADYIDQAMLRNQQAPLGLGS